MSEPTKAKSAIEWFEIPCEDLDRARTFYQNLLAADLKKDDFGDADDVMCIFPSSSLGVGGALVKRPFQQPSAQGTMVYLHCDGFLDAAIGRVVPAGGAMIVPKTAIPGGFGYFACIRDSEGNHVGLHSA